MSLPTLAQWFVQPRPASDLVAVHEGQPVSWQQFHRDTATYATLAARLPAGAAVALFDEQAYPFAAALFGLWLAGCLPVLPGNTTPGTRAALAKRVHAFWGPFGDGEPSLEAILKAEQASEGPAPSVFDVQKLSSARLELFTSGSTGEPRPVIKRVDQLEAELCALELAFGQAVQERLVLATVSHQHIYGLLFRLLWPLVSRRVFDSRLWRDSAVLTDHAQQWTGGAVWVASPAHLKRLVHDYPWSSARAGLHEVFSSGGPLPDHAARLWQQHWGRAPLEVYGSTETGGVGWRRQSDRRVWQPLPGLTVTSAGEGRLQLRSPHLPDSGWQVLDDAGQLVDGGFFTLLGRRDRIVKIEEKRVSLPELEQHLMAHPLLLEAVAMLLPGERPQLAVVAVPSTDGAALLAEQGRRALCQRLRRDLAATFEAVVLPRRWRFIDALPTDSQGKVSQAMLMALFEQAPEEPSVAPAPAPCLPEVLSSQCDGSRAELMLRFADTLAYLPGHFPQHPILPGVVQVHWVVHFARQLLGLTGEFRGMEALKFRQLSRSGRVLSLVLEYEPERQRLVFCYRSETGEHASGRLLFEPDS